MPPEDATPATDATMTRRQFLAAAGATVAGAALGGCAPDAPKPTPRGGEKAQLVYRDWRTEWFPGMAQRMLEQFQSEHPNIRVYYTLDPENAQFEEKSLADLQSGTAPDLFQGCCSSFPIWAQKGYCLDLRPYVNADLDRATIEDWDPVQYKALFGRDGVQYGLPKYHGALALYYNRDLFDQYRAPYPNAAWNHNDYLAAMRRLTRDQDHDMEIDLWGSMMDINWERLQVYVNAWGGHFVDPNDPTRSLMAESAAMQAFEWVRARMWGDRVMATPLSVQRLSPLEAFLAGRVAMVEEGSWSLKNILTNATFHIGIAPIPAGPTRRATLATTDGFGIYAGTRYPDAAWELMKFLVSKDYGRAMLQTHFLQPARASLLEEWISFIKRQYPDQARDAEIGAFADGHLRGYSVVAETFANQADALRLAQAAWQQIFALGQAPVGQMTGVSRQIQEAQQVGR